MFWLLIMANPGIVAVPHPQFTVQPTMSLYGGACNYSVDQDGRPVVETIPAVMTLSWDVNNLYDPALHKFKIFKIDGGSREIVSTQTAKEFQWVMSGYCQYGTINPFDITTTFEIEVTIDKNYVGAYQVFDTSSQATLTSTFGGC